LSRSQTCPALFITAPASGQGKTTVTAALARWMTQQGKTVRVFKTGPDYLDPQILQQASGQPVMQLDLWMAGQAWCQQQLFAAAQTADLILIEGAMGMYDGDPSSAELAARFGIPVLIVMDVKGMAQTAAALATGLANFRDDIVVAGLIANHCASERHRQLIADALPADLPLLASLTQSENIALPERHLGLVQPQEITDLLEQRLQAGAHWLASSLDSDWVSQLPKVEFFPQSIPAVEPLLAGKKIAVARDDAFSFIYQANLQLLVDMGASLQFFSPLYDQAIPSADALWLPGGYPELHAQALADNHSMLASLKEFFYQDNPILAECGGMIYCQSSFQDLDGGLFTMAGLIAGKALMRERGGCQGMQSAPLPEGELKAHAHHRTISIDTPSPLAVGRRPKHPAPGEEIYRDKNLTASYLHLFFPSNPQAIAKLFGA
jgi:cobyrinic acid a,c-diamide synthase